MGFALILPGWLCLQRRRRKTEEEEEEEEDADAEEAGGEWTSKDHLKEASDDGGRVASSLRRR